MKKIYLLVFSEYKDGNYSYYTENKDWFDWITTSETKPLPSMVESLFNNEKEMEFQDLTTMEDCEKFLTTDKRSGSFENDKALMFMHLCEPTPESRKDLIKWLSANNFEIEDEYNGLVY